MYGLLIIGLLATVTPLFADVSRHHFLMSLTPQYITCNWRVALFCNTSDVIKIHSVVVSTALCTSGCTPCSPSDDGGTSTDSSNRTLADYIKYKCENQTNCNSSLPHPGITGYNYMAHASITYNCTGTDVTLTSTTANNTENPDQEDAATPGSNQSVVAVVVPIVLVLVLVLVPLVTVVVVVRRQRRSLDTSFLTAIPTSSRVSPGNNYDAQDTATDETLDNYNTSIQNQFTVTQTPLYSYNHVNHAVNSGFKDDPPYDSAMIASDNAALAGTEQGATFKDEYSRVIKKTSNKYQPDEKNAI